MLRWLFQGVLACRAFCLYWRGFAELKAIEAGQIGTRFISQGQLLVE
jgi:hypothetical protein